MAPPGVDRLAVDEALDEVSGCSTALRPQPVFFAQVRLCGVGGDGVDRVDRRSCERVAGFSGDPEPGGFVGARVPDREQRDAVGVDELLEADPLMNTPRRHLTQEREVLPA